MDVAICFMYIHQIVLSIIRINAIRINATALYIYVYTLHTYTYTYTRLRTYVHAHAHVDPFPTLAGPLAIFRTFAVHYNTNITT